MKFTIIILFISILIILLIINKTQKYQIIRDFNQENFFNFLKFNKDNSKPVSDAIFVTTNNNPSSVPITIRNNINHNFNNDNLKNDNSTHTFSGIETPDKLLKRIESMTNEVNKQLDNVLPNMINNNPNKLNIESINIKPQSEGYINMPNNPLKTNSCKFLPSNSCNSDFPNYTGANFSSTHNFNLFTDNDDTNDKHDLPSAIAILDDNYSIEHIMIINKGKGLIKPPSIKIIGNSSKPASAIATIDSNGSINNINITDPGSNFKGTPKIIFENLGFNSLYLCCK
jgi:hypothetical protein